MYLSTLNEWLSWINTVHLSEIDLGLLRVKAVAAKLRLLKPRCPVIIVGGTNGKGSTVAGLEAIYLEAGFKVGCFTSPILFRHTEMLRMNGLEASENDFCEAYEKIEAVRGEITLTPFEYHTLASLIILQQEQLDLYILEVGLGGRLDAVNILDADLSIVTSISLDHMDWLGDTREKIGFEKAGIFRPHQKAICGDFNPPQSLIDYAHQLKTNLFCQNQDFIYEENSLSWNFHFQDIHYLDLPKPLLALQNMACVLTAVSLLQEKLPVTLNAIKNALNKVKLAGRIEIKNKPVMEIFDVSHNPASVALLANFLNAHPISGKTYAIFSMLKDKGMEASVKEIIDQIDEWFIASLKGSRGSSLDHIKQTLEKVGVHTIYSYQTIEDAYLALKKIATQADRIVVFGSFHTVAQVYLQS